MIKTLLKLPPTIAQYKLSRSLNVKPPIPINITVSVTNLCNSKCKTCFIWKLYRDHSEREKEEFKIWEFEKTFESLGKNPVWFTLSGGEPYLRHDIVKICEALCEHCSPYVMTIPTNGLLPTVIENATKKVLENCSDIKLIVNLSLDGIGEKHDEIRGIAGNFERVLDTFQRLKKLKEEYRNLSLGLHTVISKYNVDHVLQLYEFARQLDPDSYITEVAEERTELFTIQHDITPDAGSYTKTINAISKNLKRDYSRSKSLISKVTQAFRVVYYQAVIQELGRHKRIVPCYAGYASCQINPYGDVWPCCVLGYDESMGNLREVNYDFKKIWFSEKADKARKYIKSENCICPLANAHYTSILCSVKAMLRVFGA